MGDFLDRVAVPRGHADLDGAIAFNEALAREPGVDLEPGRFFDTIFFSFSWFSDLVHAFFDVDMAGGARADPAARVLDVDAMLDRNFQQVLPLGRHDIMDRLIGASDGLGVFQMEADLDGGGAVIVIGVSQMHGFALRDGGSARRA